MGFNHKVILEIERQFTFVLKRKNRIIVFQIYIYIINCCQMLSKHLERVLLECIFYTSQTWLLSCLDNLYASPGYAFNDPDRNIHIKAVSLFRMAEMAERLDCMSHNHTADFSFASWINLSYRPPVRSRAAAELFSDNWQEIVFFIKN